MISPTTASSWTRRNNGAAAALLSLLLLMSTTPNSPLLFTHAQEATQAPSLAPTTSAAPSAVAWQGCNDPNAVDGDPIKKVTIGDTTTVCLQLGNGVNWAGGVDYIRMAFQPTADEYTRFFVPKSYTDLLVTRANDASSIWFNKNITAGIASQTSLSFLRQYFDFANGNVFPYLTAIIDVKDGIVQGITWDDACVFCSGQDSCLENTFDFDGNVATQASSGQPTQGCFQTQEKCNESLIKEDGTGGTGCDLLIYVVWTGTDANGISFQSAASRFSNFPAQELQDRVAQNLPQVSLLDFDRREL